MEIDFHKQFTPLANGETLHRGCVFCDPLLNSTANSAFGRISVRRGRGRGRGRGGRGRGRGRGGKNIDPRMTFDGF